MRLLVQPDDGIAPLVAAVKNAKKSVEIVIFRLDRKEMETALQAAVERGVAVRALIAHTNRGGEKTLRSLEGRLLAMGITVARTGDDLARYHGKMLIVDARMIYVLTFNFAHIDVDHSRGFGILTKNAEFIQEGRKLFEADCARQPYTPGLQSFLVSPANARNQIAEFIRDARKQLLIYDPRVSDRQMIRLLEERRKAGVDVRIIGRVAGRKGDLVSAPLTTMRLHAKVIIRDRRQAFVGSQGLRQVELDSRREIGFIVRDSKIVNGLLAVFEKDWTSTDYAKGQEADAGLDAKALAKELPPLAATVRQAVKKVVENANGEALADDEVRDTVKKTVKKAVKEAIKEVVEEKQISP
ncbi:MAG TPA: phospholipase D-like domain-containing protein [Terriglobales bacterium]|nr:phospholipase D-like domain-containing protein [Terriglobales bacterium]